MYRRYVVWEFLRSGIVGAAASSRTENFKSCSFGCSVRVVGMVCVQATGPLQRKLGSAFRRSSKSIRQFGRNLIEDERRRNSGVVVVVGALFEPVCAHTMRH